MFFFYSLLFISFSTWFFSIIFVPKNISYFKNIKKLSVIFSFLNLFIILFIWIFFNNLDLLSILNLGIFHSHLDIQWTFFFNIYYILGIDNITLLFLLLTFILIPISILISLHNIKYKFKEFVIIIVLIEFILFNIFRILDLIFFYIFFESILIPMFLLIGIWGSRQRKIHAVYQFFFYTIIGSLIMLLAILMIYSNVQITDIRLLYGIEFSGNRELFLWSAFFLAFAVKVPIFPFHIWLPEAHVEAPTVGSVILAGILLKLGTYGLLRFVIPFFAYGTSFYLPFIYTFSILGILYTSCTTVRQIDLKKVIAYASVGHMSYVIIGLFTSNLQGLSGSIFLMISHGIVSGGLFFGIGVIYDRYKTRLIKYYRGLIQVMPLFALFLFILTSSNISFPGTSNFVGEFLILIGICEHNLLVTFIATISIILTAVYSIWLYNRIVFGSLTSKYYINFADLSLKEFYIMFIFSFLSVLLGLKPNIILNITESFTFNYINYK
jgi:proton-translocating NADH-quinone oxidoreductase chain M